MLRSLTLGILRAGAQAAVLLYPAEFRRTYGRDMAEVFDDLCTYHSATL